MSSYEAEITILLLLKVVGVWIFLLDFLGISYYDPKDHLRSWTLGIQGTPPHTAFCLSFGT